MRTLRSLAALLCLAQAAPGFADSFDVQGGYRGAKGNDWKAGEFMIHYLSEELNSFSFGAYFSSNYWRRSDRKRAQHIEGGPEIRWQIDQDKNSWFGALQYAALSSGKAQTDHDIGIRVHGPRLLAGLVLPFEDGFVMNVGLTKGFEKITYYGDDRTTQDFASFGAFVGFSL